MDELQENTISELSRLGRSVGQIIQVIDTLVQKKVYLFAIKEHLSINGEQDIQTKIMVTLLSLFAEIKRDLIAERTKQGLAVARTKGRLIGRPKGSGSSKLDEQKEQIINFLENGSNKTFIAKKFKTSHSNLYRGLKKEKLLDLFQKKRS